MALIEYQLGYDVNNQPTVTFTVLEVDTGDRIQFKSSYPGEQAGIQYKGDSPFLDPKAPQANLPFPVNGTAGPFTVAKNLTSDHAISFACGTVTVEKGTSATGGTPASSLKFTPWPNGVGNGTPPRKSPPGGG